MDRSRARAASISESASEKRAESRTLREASRGEQHVELLHDCLRSTRRGRWASDIGDIYARTAAAEALQTSLDISLAIEDDLESLVPGWVQPAAVQRRA